MGFGMDSMAGVSGDMGSLFTVSGDLPGPFLFSEEQNLVGNTPYVPILSSFSPCLFLAEVGFEGSIGVTDPHFFEPFVGSSSVSCDPLGFEGVIASINLSMPYESTRHVVVSSVDDGEYRSQVKSSKKARLAKKQKKRPNNIIFGEGVTMDQSKSCAEMILVGRARGRNPGFAFLKKWVEEHRGGKLSSLSIIRLLEKNGLAFYFSLRRMRIRFWIVRGCGLAFLSSLKSGARHLMRLRKNLHGSRFRCAFLDFLYTFGMMRVSR